MADENLDAKLAKIVSSYWNDPLGYVLFAWDWKHDSSIQMVELPEQYKRLYPGATYGPDLWACEVMEKIREQVIKNNFNGRDAVPSVNLAVASGHGLGKAEYVDKLVDTPMGRRRWGDLQPGDLLWGPDGRPTRILAIPYEGVRPCYRVTFDDGASTIVAQEHLWSVRGRAQRRVDRVGGPSKEWITLETRDLLRLGVKRKNGASLARQWEIPIHQGVQGEELDLPYDPYLLGLWIGNGCQNRIQFSSMDVVFEFGYVTNWKGWKCDVAENGNCYTMRMRGLIPVLRELDLLGCRSNSKFIPERYKRASYGQRLKLLQGLVDSDGEVDKKGSLVYSTVSPRLRDDVVWLVRSLGGKARVQPTPKNAFYKDSEGNRIYCQLCYRVTITMPRGVECGYYRDRTERLKHTLQDRYLTRWIDSIEYVGDLPTKCVTVDREDGLYLTNDFIVTHNSALTAWLVNWILDTRYGAKGMVTANTGAQLKSKTWAEITKWGQKKITAHWWQFKSTEITSKFAPAAWRVDAVTWDEKKSEAFAGQHAASSSSFYIFDEASIVPDSIWEVAKGGLTDGEPFFFAFGNPTRNTGAFYDCFHEKKNELITYQVDSRTAAITNKDYIERLLIEYGEDSDFFRVRVKGEFPKESSNLFISRDKAEAAYWREEPERFENQNAFLGVDVARYGEDSSVLQVRYGRNARMKPEMFSKTSITETAKRVAMKIDELKERYGFGRVLTFVDGGGVGGGVVDVLRDLGYEDIFDVNFGQKADDNTRFANKRAEMWSRMRDWLSVGSIVRSRELIDQLVSPEFCYNKANKLTLESKEDMRRRGVKSPDWADALALTFYLQNQQFDIEENRFFSHRKNEEYNPFGDQLENDIEAFNAREDF